MSLMSKLSLKNIFIFIIDFPELLLRNFYALIMMFLLPGNRNKKKIKTLSANAGIIESKNKGLKVISIEVMDGFSVYHGVHKKQIKPESLKKMRDAIATKLENKNVFVSFEGEGYRTLKVVIQN